MYMQGFKVNIINNKELKLLRENLDLYVPSFPEKGSIFWANDIIVVNLGSQNSLKKKNYDIKTWSYKGFTFSISNNNGGELTISRPLNRDIENIFMLHIYPDNIEGLSSVKREKYGFDIKDFRWENDKQKIINLSKTQINQIQVGEYNKGAIWSKYFDLK